MSKYDEDEKDEIIDAYNAITEAANGRVPYAILEAACMLVGEVMAMAFDESDVPKNKNFAAVMERIERSYVLHKMEGRKQ